MHELPIGDARYDLGARRVHWHYDDPSGVPDLGLEADGVAGRPIQQLVGELRVRARRLLTPKAA
jgi:hypothetical protein